MFWLHFLFLCSFFLALLPLPGHGSDSPVTPSCFSERLCLLMEPVFSHTTVEYIISFCFFISLFCMSFFFLNFCPHGHETVMGNSMDLSGRNTPTGLEANKRDSFHISAPQSSRLELGVAHTLQDYSFFSLQKKKKDNIFCLEYLSHPHSAQHPQFTWLTHAHPSVLKMDLLPLGRLPWHLTPRLHLHNPELYISVITLNSPLSYKFHSVLFHICHIHLLWPLPGLDAGI